MRTKRAYISPIAFHWSQQTSGSQVLEELYSHLSLSREGASVVTWSPQLNPDGEMGLFSASPVCGRCRVPATGKESSSPTSTFIVAGIFTVYQPWGVLHAVCKAPQIHQTWVRPPGEGEKCSPFPYGGAIWRIMSLPKLFPQKDLESRALYFQLWQSKDLFF